MTRAVTVAVAAALLIVEACAAVFALYVATGPDTIFTGALAIFQLALAVSAVCLACAALASALRTAFPARAWILIAGAAALGVAWFALIAGVSENA